MATQHFGGFRAAAVLLLLGVVGCAGLRVAGPLLTIGQGGHAPLLTPPLREVRVLWVPSPLRTDVPSYSNPGIRFDVDCASKSDVSLIPVLYSPDGNSDSAHVIIGTNGRQKTWHATRNLLMKGGSASPSAVIGPGPETITIMSRETAVRFESFTINGDCTWRETGTKLLTFEIDRGTLLPASWHSFESFVECEGGLCTGGAWERSVTCVAGDPVLLVGLTVLHHQDTVDPLINITLKGVGVTLVRTISNGFLSYWNHTNATVPVPREGTYSLRIEILKNSVRFQTVFLRSTVCAFDFTQTDTATATLPPTFTPTFSSSLSGTATATPPPTPTATPSVSRTPSRTVSRTGTPTKTFLTLTSTLPSLPASLPRLGIDLYVQNSVAAAAAVSSVFMSVQGHPMMTPLVLTTLQCPVDELPVVWNPLSLTVLGNVFAGCVVGNTLLLLGITVVHYGAVVAMKAFGKPMNERRAQGAVRFPSLSMHAAFTLYPAYIISGVKLIQLGGGYPALALAALLGMGLGFPLFILRVLTNLNAVFVQDNRSGLRLWMTGEGVWRSFPPEDRMVDRFGVLFRFNLPTQVRFLWGMGMSFVLAAISGVNTRTPGGCGMQRYLMAGVIVAYGIMVLKDRPFVVPRHFYGELLICALQGTSMGCVASGYYFANATYLRVGQVFSCVALGVVVFNTLLDFLTAILSLVSNPVKENGHLVEDLSNLDPVVTPSALRASVVSFPPPPNLCLYASESNPLANPSSYSLLSLPLSSSSLRTMPRPCSSL